MCKFYSAIVSKNGELYHNPFSTSHEEIIDSCELKDDPSLICRIEFYPKDEKDTSDYKKYQLHFDDQRPDWFTDQMESDIIKKLKVIIKNMIITKDRECLIGKCVILKDCKINYIKNSVVYNMNNSQVNQMRDNSQVNEMWENSQVNQMRDNSQVNQMRENSRVNEMWENSRVNQMRENSQVNQMRENSQVNEMRENSRVNLMRGNSQVNQMRENSQVNQMRDNSQVNEMWENSQVNQMLGNSQVNINNSANKNPK